MESHCGQRMAFSDDLHRVVIKWEIRKCWESSERCKRRLSLSARDSQFLCLTHVGHTKDTCHRPTTALEVSRERKIAQNSLYIYIA